jgi:hypothetical protein
MMLTLILITLASLVSCNYLIYRGRVAVKGNEPFVYVALVVDENQEYSIVGPLKDVIREKYQGRYLEVKGRVAKRAAESGLPAPALPAELEVLEILAVSDKPFKRGD